MRPKSLPHSRNYFSQHDRWRMTSVKRRRTTSLLSHFFPTWFKSGEVNTVPPHVFWQGSSSLAFFQYFPARPHSVQVSIQVRCHVQRDFCFCPFFGFLLCVFAFLAFCISIVRCLWDDTVFLAFLPVFFFCNELTLRLRVDLVAYGLLQWKELLEFF